MKFDSRSSSLIIGMALFAMFFGSGNLIYPLFIGTQANVSWLSTMFGFILTAVFLPFLGVIAMVLYKGNYDNFFSIIGKKKGFVLSIILLTVWIPLGSAPRCMALSYASLNSYFSNMPPLWIFSLIYSFLVFWIISGKIGVLDFLGKFITPLLLACIGFITFKGFMMMDSFHPVQNFDLSVFATGLLEGYNTMDLVASFFFSASIIHLIIKAGGKMTQSLVLVFKSSIVGMLLLGLVYLCLIALSAHYYQHINEIPKDQMLAYLSQHILGPHLSFVAILAIILACFSTSIALIIAYTDFLHEEIFKARQHPNFSICLALLVTFIMSLFGLEGISYVTEPVLQICYPLLLSLIILNIIKYFIKNRKFLMTNNSNKE